MGEKVRTSKKTIDIDLDLLSYGKYGSSTMNLSFWFIVGGIVLIVIGVLIWLGMPIGKLPGDIHIETKNTNIYIPIVTSIVISILLTIFVNAIFYLLRK